MTTRKIALDSLVNAIMAIVTEDEVVSFRYPEDAIEYVKQNSCDIAFLDVEMAGMSGGKSKSADKDKKKKKKKTRIPKWEAV